MFRTRSGAHPNNHRKHHAGFTLLEMLTVMSIIGFIVGVAVPRMFLAVDALAAEAEQQVLTELAAHIKLYAFLRNEPQNLVFEGRSAYWPPQHSSIADFEHLWFNEQTIKWNSNGIADSGSLSYTFRGRQRQLNLR